MHLLNTFFQTDTDDPQFCITGRQAVPFLSQSGLDRDILRILWTTVDPGSTGKLFSSKQFYVILRLVALAQGGILIDALHDALSLGQQETITVRQCLLHTAYRTDIQLASFQGYLIPSESTLQSLYFQKKCGTTMELQISGQLLMTTSSVERSLSSGASTHISEAQYPVNSHDDASLNDKAPESSFVSAACELESVQLSSDDAFGGLGNVADAPLAPLTMSSTTYIQNDQVTGKRLISEVSPTFDTIPQLTDDAQPPMVGVVDLAPSSPPHFLRDVGSEMTFGELTPSSDTHIMNSFGSYPPTMCNFDAAVPDSYSDDGDDFGDFFAATSIVATVACYELDALATVQDDPLSSLLPTEYGLRSLEMVADPVIESLSPPFSSSSVHGIDDFFRGKASTALSSYPVDNGAFRALQSSQLLNVDNVDFDDFTHRSPNETNIGPPVEQITEGAWDSFDAFVLVRDAPLQTLQSLSLEERHEPLPTLANGIKHDESESEFFGDFVCTDTVSAELSEGADLTTGNSDDNLASHKLSGINVQSMQFDSATDGIHILPQGSAESGWGILETLTATQDGSFPKLGALQYATEVNHDDVGVFVATAVAPRGTAKPDWTDSASAATKDSSLPKPGALFRVEEPSVAVAKNAEVNNSNVFGDFVSNETAHNEFGDCVSNETAQSEVRQHIVPQGIAKPGWDDFDVLASTQLLSGDELSVAKKDIYDDSGDFVVDETVETEVVPKGSTKLGWDAVDTLVASLPKLGALLIIEEPPAHLAKCATMNKFEEFGDFFGREDAERKGDHFASSSGSEQGAMSSVDAPNSLSSPLTDESSAALQGSGIDTVVAKPHESGWDALDSLGGVADAYLPSLSSFSIGKPGIEPTAPADVAERQFRKDKDVSDDCEICRSSGGLNRTAGCEAVPEIDPVGSASFDLRRQYTDQPLTPWNDPGERDRMVSEYPAAQVKSVSTFSEDCAGPVDADEFDRDDKSTNSVYVVTIGDRTNVSIKEYNVEDAFHIHSKTYVECSNGLSFNAFDSAASSSVPTLPAAGGSSTVPPKTVFSAQFSCKNFVDPEVFGDFSPFHRADSIEGMTSTIFANRAPCEAKVEEGSSLVEFRDFELALQTIACEDDKFDEFEAVNHNDAIGVGPSADALVVTLVTADDSLGDFAAFVDFSRTVSETEVDIVHSGDWDAMRGLSEAASDRVPSEGDLLELVRSRSSVVHKSFDMPKEIRRKDGAAGCYLDFGICFDANIWTESPVSKDRRNRLLRCGELIDLLSSSHMKLASSHWAESITVARDELAKGALLLEDATSLPKIDLDFVRRELQIFVDCLGEFVRITRNITATIGDLLMLDASALLTIDTLSSLWSSNALVCASLEVEELWKDVEAMGTTLGLRSKSDSAHKLDTLVEIRSIPSAFCPMSELCNFTLRDLSELTDPLSTKTPAAWEGKLFMVGAANFLGNKGTFYTAGE